MKREPLSHHARRAEAFTKMIETASAIVSTFHLLLIMALFYTVGRLVGFLVALL